MKIKGISLKSKTHGLTLVDVLVVLVVLAIAIVLAVLLLPSIKTVEKSKSIICINNLRQIGSAFVMYADDNSGKFPFQTSVTNVAAKRIYDDHVFPYFQKVGHGLEPKVIVCPFDVARHAAANIQALSDSSISYFLNADALRDSPVISILSGDRFLQTNGQPIASGLFMLTTNLNVSWTPSIHNGGGNVLWSDGSVQQTASYGWPSIIKSQPLATNGLLIP
jgi:prepilin-type processing-associated H-X9-DG protein